MVKVSEDGKWYRVSLRLMGDGLPVGEIEERLGLTASSVGVKGEHYQGDSSRGRYESNVWVWKYLSKSDVLFEEQITGLLRVIEPKKNTLKDILSMDGVEGEIFLGFSSENGQGGAYFSPDLLLRVSDCGLALGLDLYPPSGDGEES